MAVVETPILIFIVELTGLDLEIRATDAPVFDEEGRNVVVLLELLGGADDAGRDLEVTALLETPQTLEGPVEDPRSLLLYVSLDFWVLLAFFQLRESHDFHAPEET